MSRKNVNSSANKACVMLCNDFSLRDCSNVWCTSAK